MNSIDKVSVIIPCFNNEDTIIETLNSVFNQTYNSIEIIIVNDGSSDNSEETIKNYIANHNDFNITLINQTNSGPSFARNNGAKKATGTYLLFLDADDKIAPEYVSECVAVFNSKSDAVLVYAEAELFEAETGIWALSDFKMPDFLIQNCIYISAVIKREQFEKAGGFDETIRFSEDWELWIKLIKHFGEGVYKIPKPLFFYRKRANQNSLTDAKDINDYSEKCKAYIYHKHYDFYIKHQLDLVTLYNFRADFKKLQAKYYNIWYKKMFYFFKKRK